MLYKDMRRVYVEPQDLVLGSLQLSPNEGRYLRQVLRMQIGDAIELFDAQGRVAQAQLSHVGKRKIICEVDEIQTTAAESAPEICIALALIKNDALDLALRMLCEVGVQRVQLLHCEFSVTKWKNSSDKAMQRLKRVAIAALRQSGRAWMPQILPPIDLAPWLESCASDPRYFGDLGQGDKVNKKQADEVKPEAIHFAIGPEGGFSESERSILLEQGAQAVTLGAHILRAETAAVVAASWMQQHCGGMG